MLSHDYPFDPTYGMDLPALLKVPPAPEPADFAAYWQNTYNEARAVPPRAELSLSSVERPGWETFDVSFTAFGGVRLGGWLARPQGKRVRRGLVVSHGYGGRDEPDTIPLLPDAAMIFPCARGLSRSRSPAIPDLAFDHVLHGIERRETYVHRGGAADIWAAVTVLSEFAPEAAPSIGYVGTSYGGGIGALAVPWDERFRCAFLGLPSFGQHPLRLQQPCVGSGEAVRQYAVCHPEVAGVLQYHDASISAKYLHRPTLVAAAVFDPAVPPPGQFAVYNALPGPKDLIVLTAGHFGWPGSESEDLHTRSVLQRFLDRFLSG